MPRSARAVGAPADVARELVAEAAHGRSVTRLVAGDPLTVDAVVAEALAVSAAGVPFDVVPGVPSGTAVPAYAGRAAGLGARRGRRPRRASTGPGWPLPPASSCCTPRPSHLPEVASALTMNGIPAQTPVAVTTNGTFTTQRTVQATLATLAAEGAELAGPLVLTIGDEVGLRAELSWWESRALYGWRVLVPRTKDQAGAMSERLRRARRHRRGGADDRRRAAALAHADGARGQGPRRRPLPVGRLHLHQRRARGVGEVRRVRARRARVLRRQDRLRRQATADKVREFGITPDLVPNETEPAETSSEGLLSIFPPHDDILDPVDRVLLPRADIATETLAAGLRDRGWEIDDVTAYRTVRAAPPPAPIREAIKTGGFDAVCFTSSSTVRNLVGIAGKPHARTIVAVHRPADRRDRPRVRAAGGRAARRGPGARPGRRARRARRPPARRGRPAPAAEGEGPPPLEPAPSRANPTSGGGSSAPGAGVRSIDPPPPTTEAGPCRIARALGPPRAGGQLRCRSDSRARASRPPKNCWTWRLGEANEARREDVQARLHATRRLLHDTRLRVQVAGGHRQGKSALIEALMMSAREDARPAGGFASRLDLVEVPAVGATATPQQAHVVLFVSDSAAPLTGAELARLRAAVEGCPMTVFVQTKIDACAGWRDVLNRNIALMRDAGLSVETWVVSSVGRLRGGWTGDERLTVGSGLPALVGQLQMLWSDFEMTGLRIVSHHLLAVITELDGMVRQRRAELAEPAVGEDLAARIAELDARQTDLRERAVRWPPLLANGFAKIHADTAFDLRVPRRARAHPARPDARRPAALRELAPDGALAAPPVDAGRQGQRRARPQREQRVRRGRRRALRASPARARAPGGRRGRVEHPEAAASPIAATRRSSRSARPSTCSCGPGWAS